MRTDFQYVTVVCKVEDHAAFEQRWDDIHELFKLDHGPVRVTAVSLDDEITRKELMMEAAEKIDDPLDLREALSEIDCADNVHAIELETTSP